MLMRRAKTYSSFGLVV